MLIILAEITKFINFSILFKGYGSFKTVEDAMQKMHQIMENLNEKTKFIFTFKTFDKKRSINFIMRFFPPNTKKYKNNKKYEIEVYDSRMKGKNLKELAFRYYFIIAMIKRRYFTGAFPDDYDIECEGYDEELDKLCY